MLGFITQLTDAPELIGPHDVAALRSLGLSDRAIVDATYICIGFNIINRIADTMHFKVPQTELFVSGAWVMRRYGYQLMSGSFAKKNRGGVSSSNGTDPYEGMMRHLQNSVFSGPGTLAASLRQAIGEGRNVGGELEFYVNKVEQRDYAGLDRCISALRSEGYSEDQIFEATVCAALRAGLERLRIALNAARDQIQTSDETKWAQFALLNEH